MTSQALTHFFTIYILLCFFTSRLAANLIYEEDDYRSLNEVPMTWDGDNVGETITAYFRIHLNMGIAQYVFITQKLNFYVSPARQISNTTNEFILAATPFSGTQKPKMYSTNLLLGTFSRIGCENSQVFLGIPGSGDHGTPKNNMNHLQSGESIESFPSAMDTYDVIVNQVFVKIDSSYPEDQAICRLKILFSGSAVFYMGAKLIGVGTSHSTSTDYKNYFFSERYLFTKIDWHLIHTYGYMSYVYSVQFIDCLNDQGVPIFEEVPALTAGPNGYSTATLLSVDVSLANPNCDDAQCLFCENVVFCLRCNPGHTLVQTSKDTQICEQESNTHYFRNPYNEYQRQNEFTDSYHLVKYTINGLDLDVEVNSLGSSQTVTMLAIVKGAVFGEELLIIPNIGTGQQVITQGIDASSSVQATIGSSIADGSNSYSIFILDDPLTFIDLENANQRYHIAEFNHLMPKTAVDISRGSFQFLSASTLLDPDLNYLVVLYIKKVVSAGEIKFSGAFQSIDIIVNGILATTESYPANPYTFDLASYGSANDFLIITLKLKPSESTTFEFLDPSQASSDRLEVYANRYFPVSYSYHACPQQKYDAYLGYCVDECSISTRDYANQCVKECPYFTHREDCQELYVREDSNYQTEVDLSSNIIFQNWESSAGDSYYFMFQALVGVENYEGILTIGDPNIFALRILTPNIVKNPIENYEVLIDPFTKGTQDHLAHFVWKVKQSTDMLWKTTCNDEYSINSLQFTAFFLNGQHSETQEVDFQQADYGFQQPFNTYRAMISSTIISLQPDQPEFTNAQCHIRFTFKGFVSVYIDGIFSFQARSPFTDGSEIRVTLQSYRFHQGDAHLINVYGVHEIIEVKLVDCFDTDSDFKILSIPAIQYFIYEYEANRLEREEITPTVDCDDDNCVSGACIAYQVCDLCNEYHCLDSEGECYDEDSGYFFIEISSGFMCQPQNVLEYSGSNIDYTGINFQIDLENFDSQLSDKIMIVKSGQVAITPLIPLFDISQNEIQFETTNSGNAQIATFEIQENETPIGFVWISLQDLSLQGQNPVDISYFYQEFDEEPQSFFEIKSTPVRHAMETIPVNNNEYYYIQQFAIENSMATAGAGAGYLDFECPTALLEIYVNGAKSEVQGDENNEVKATQVVSSGNYFHIAYKFRASKNGQFSSTNLIPDSDRVLYYQQSSVEVAYEYYACSDGWLYVPQLHICSQSCPNPLYVESGQQCLCTISDCVNLPNIELEFEDLDQLCKGTASLLVEVDGLPIESFDYDIVDTNDTDSASFKTYLQGKSASQILIYPSHLKWNAFYEIEVSFLYGIEASHQMILSKTIKLGPDLMLENDVNNPSQCFYSQPIYFTFDIVCTTCSTSNKYSRNQRMIFDIDITSANEIPKNELTYEWHIGPSSIIKTSQLDSRLILEPGDYTGLGSSITITLICYKDNQQSYLGVMSSPLTLDVNSAPTSGSLSVSPSSGTSLITDFTFKALNWVDDDKPLIYVFSYKFESSSEYQDLTDSSNKDKKLTTILISSGTTQEQIQIRVRVYDSLGLYSEATKELTLKKKVTESVTEEVEFLSELISKDIESQTLTTQKANLIAQQLQNIESNLTATSSKSPCPDCSGHGSCNSKNVCKCDSGYTLNDCSMKSTIKTEIVNTKVSILQSMKDTLSDPSLALEDRETSLSTIQTLANNTELNNEESMLLIENMLETTFNLSDKNVILNEKETETVSKTVDSLFEYLQSDCEGGETDELRSSMKDTTSGYFETLSRSQLDRAVVNDFEPQIMTKLNYDILTYKSTLCNIENQDFDQLQHAPKFNFSFTGSSSQKNCDQVVNIQYYAFQEDFLKCNEGVVDESTLRSDFAIKITDSESGQDLSNLFKVDVEMPPGISCPSGCEKQSSGLCECGDIGLFDLEKQMLKIFAESQLFAIANVWALANWNFIESYAFWGVVILTVGCIANHFLLYYKWGKYSVIRCEHQKKDRIKSKFWKAVIMFQPLLNLFFIYSKELPKTYRNVIYFMRLITALMFSSIFGTTQTFNDIGEYLIDVNPYLYILPYFTVIPICTLFEYFLRKPPPAHAITTRLRRIFLVKRILGVFFGIIGSGGSIFVIFVLAANKDEEQNKAWRYDFGFTLIMDNLINPLLFILIQYLIIKIADISVKTLKLKNMKGFVARQLVNGQFLKIQRGPSRRKLKKRSTTVSEQGINNNPAPQEMMNQSTSHFQEQEQEEHKESQEQLINDSLASTRTKTNPFSSRTSEAMPRRNPFSRGFPRPNNGRHSRLRSITGALNTNGSLIQGIQEEDT